VFRSGSSNYVGDSIVTQWLIRELRNLHFSDSSILNWVCSTLFEREERGYNILTECSPSSCSQLAMKLFGNVCLEVYSIYDINHCNMTLFLLNF